MKIVKEPIINNFIILDDGTKFLYEELVSTITQMLNTTENDFWGDNSFRDYEVSNLEVADYLVKLGCVKRHIGPRQSTLYFARDKEKLEKFLEKIENFAIAEFEKEEKPTNYISKTELIEYLMNNYDSNWKFHDLLKGIETLKTY